MNNKKIMSKVIASSLVLALGTINAVPVFAYSKDETVYTKANANGSSYQTIVSEHLKNSDNAELLKDMSTLLNIKNTNGDEEASQNGTSLEWKTSGNDIYYQGNTDKELPLDCSIKYELNGEEIAPNDLIGKSGNVKITIEYTNREERFVNINGKSEKMYVPFVVMAGTMLDNTKMKNIEVTNGKVLDNGQKTVVVGLACPGLIESLGLEDEDLPDLNKVEISFEATDFEMENIMSYATPKIFDDADISAMDKLDEVYSQINDLKSASTQLVEGAKTLQDGTEEYVSKSTEFADGLETFNQGINTATNSYNKIDEGIDSVNSNISKLNKGASDLSDGLNSLQTGVSAGKEQAVSSLEKSSKTLSAGIEQIIAGKDQEVETIKEQVIENANSKLAEGLKTGISSAVSSAIDSTMEKKMASIKKEILADETLTKEEKLAIQKALSSISISDTEKQAMSKQIGTAIDSAVAQTTKAQEAGLDAINDNEKGVKAGLNTLKTQAESSIKSGISEISSGFDAITDGTTELIAGSNELKNGTSTLSQGTSKLQTGVSTLASGSKELKTGLSTLNTSSDKLNSANKQLLEGASTISDGAKTLAEGISEFDKEGINKIVSMVNGDVKDLQTRVEKLQDLANEYDSFAGKDEEAEGTTKFIFVVDSLKKDSKKEESNMPVENSESVVNNEENKETNSGK